MRLTQIQEDLANDPVSKFLRKPRGAGDDEQLTVRNAEWRAGNLLKSPSERQHSKRSERAQTVDENHNAPLPDTYGQWARNPNRYDLPGVDTIPEEKERERAESFAHSQKERGAISNIDKSASLETKTAGHFAKGTFSAGDKSVQVGDFISEDEEAFVLSHEAGHAADAFATPGETTTSRESELDKMFETEEKKQKVSDDLTALSKRARGQFGDGDTYRSSTHERIADAVSLTVLEPRAARREGGEAVDFLEEQGLL